MFTAIAMLLVHLFICLFEHPAMSIELSFCIKVTKQLNLKKKKKGFFYSTRGRSDIMHFFHSSALFFYCFFLHVNAVDGPVGLLPSRITSFAMSRT